MAGTLLVALGGALGSVGRYWLALLIGRLTGPNFPWGIIIINIIGSFVIGIVAVLPTTPEARVSIPSEARVFLMVGICGGFTTFSSFSLQTFELMREGRMGLALANILLSVLLCLAATTAGYASASALLHRQVTSSSPS